MRLEFKVPHDVLVAWVQNLLTTIAARWGEEAVLESIQETHQSIWGDRYENWAKMTPHEKMALDRGGHARRALQRRAPPRRHDAARRRRPPGDGHGAVRQRRRAASRRSRDRPAALIRSATMASTSSHTTGPGKRPASTGTAATARSPWSGCRRSATAVCCARSITSWIPTRRARGTSTRTRTRPAPITTLAPVADPARRAGSRRGLAGGVSWRQLSLQPILHPPMTELASA